MKRLVLCGTVIVMGMAAALRPLPVHASGSTIELDTDVEPAAEGRIITLGFGLAIAPDYEGSDDYKGVPVPLARLVYPSGRYAELIGNTFRFNALSGRTWSLGPTARYRAKRDDVESNQVDRMEAVDAAVEVGLFAGYAVNQWKFRVEGAKDVASGHEGSLVGLSAGYTWPLDSLKVTLSAATTWANDDYMTAYFGVNSRDSAASGLETFDAEASFKDWSVTLVSMYRLTARWDLIGGLRYTNLLGDAEDSPIVKEEGEDKQFLGVLVASYTF